MTRSILALMVVVMAVSACGIKRPLMRPKDIPAYEAKRARKMQKFDQPSATTTPAALPKPAPEIVPAFDTIQPGRKSLEETMSPFPPVEQ